MAYCDERINSPVVATASYFLTLRESPLFVICLVQSPLQLILKSTFNAKFNRSNHSWFSNSFKLSIRSKLLLRKKLFSL